MNTFIHYLGLGKHLKVESESNIYFTPPAILPPSRGMVFYFLSLEGRE